MRSPTRRTPLQAGSYAGPPVPLPLARQYRQRAPLRHLYHYPKEITLKKVPLRDPDREQTAKSREKIEDFVKQNHAQLWIAAHHVGISGDRAMMRSPRIAILEGDD
jgi:hypothetical protein